MASNVVRFAAYRLYEEKRVAASNAMMGLLAGSQLASHLLRLTEGSQRLLPEVFPKVPHIGRLNLTTASAQAVLDAADSHLGAMSVPYALALHEDFLRSCLDLLVRAGRFTKNTAANTKLHAQHAAVATATGGNFDPDGLALLETLRLMRNCTIHAGGRASPALVSRVASWTGSTESAWVRMTKRSLRGLRPGDAVDFGHSELFLCMAVTKALAHEANGLLQPALPAALWADLVIEDLVASHSGALRAPDPVRLARGLARFHYGPLQLTDRELRDAVARA